MIGLGLGKQAIALLSEPPDGGMTQLTGDVLAGPGSGSQAATIAARAVTVAKFQAIATSSILGRTTAGSGDVEILTAAQARSVIGAVNIAGDTMTGPLVISANGAVNVPVFKLTGTPYEGTTPFAVIGPTPVGDALGCMLAVNCPNGFGGNVLDIFADGASAFKVTGNGTVAVSAGLTLGYSSSTNLISEATDTLALRRTTNAQTIRLYRTYTNSSNYARLRLGWNTTTALVMAEGLGSGSDGSVAFNDAALATNATVGFIMLPSCAGAPSGVPSNIPTGQIPVVYDSTNNKIYAYNGSWRSVTLT